MCGGEFDPDCLLRSALARGRRRKGGSGDGGERNSSMCRGREWRESPTPSEASLPRRARLQPLTAHIQGSKIAETGANGSRSEHRGSSCGVCGLRKEPGETGPSGTAAGRRGVAACCACSLPSDSAKMEHTPCACPRGRGGARAGSGGRRARSLGILCLRQYREARQHRARGTQVPAFFFAWNTVLEGKDGGRRVARQAVKP